MITEEAKKWITKALNDYKTAEILINQPEENLVTDSICFHCQQAVEKLLKAFLIQNEVEFKRTHSLEYLIKLCSEIDKDFLILYDITGSLTNYAIEVRYPDDFYTPSKEEAEKAIEIVKTVKNIILNKLGMQL